MRARRILSAVAATVMVAGGVTLAAAPGAMAVLVPVGCSDVSVQLTQVSTLGGVVVNQELLDLNPGDVLVLTVNSISGTASATIVFGGAFGTGIPVGTTLTSVGSTTFEIPTSGSEFIGIQGLFAGVASLDATLTCTPPGSSTAATAGAVPDWIQGYGRGSARDACLDGWNPSWAQWPNGGNGGFTCVRNVPSLG